jgi:hypothetical protein
MVGRLRAIPLQRPIISILATAAKKIKVADLTSRLADIGLQ